MDHNKLIKLLELEPNLLNITNPRGETVGEQILEHVVLTDPKNVQLHKLLLEKGVKPFRVRIFNILQTGDVDLLRYYDTRKLIADLHNAANVQYLSRHDNIHFTPEIYEYLLAKGVPINFNTNYYITRALYQKNITTALWLLQKNPSIINKFTPLYIAQFCDFNLIRAFKNAGMVFSLPIVREIKGILERHHCEQKDLILKLLEGPEYKAAESIEAFRHSKRTQPLITSENRELPVWGEICMHLDSTYRLDELEEIAQDLGLIVPDSIDTKASLEATTKLAQKLGITIPIASDINRKRALCAALATDYEKYKGLDQEENTVQDYNCHNDPIIEDDYNSLPPSQIIRFTENGHVYCFSREEFKGLLDTTRRNPYTQAPLPQSAINEYNGVRDAIRESVHHTRTVHLRPSTALRAQLVSLLTKLTESNPYLPVDQILQMTPEQVTGLQRYFSELRYTGMSRIPIDTVDKALAQMIQLALSQRPARDVALALHMYVRDNIANA